MSTLVQLLLSSERYQQINLVVGTVDYAATIHVASGSVFCAIVAGCLSNCALSELKAHASYTTVSLLQHDCTFMSAKSVGSQFGPQVAVAASLVLLINLVQATP